MFYRLDLRIVAITEAYDDLSELRRDVQDLVRRFDIGDDAVIRFAESTQPMSDAAAAFEVIELGAKPEDLGLSAEGARLQLSFDFSA